MLFRSSAELSDLPSALAALDRQSAAYAERALAGAGLFNAADQSHSGEEITSRLGASSGREQIAHRLLEMLVEEEALTLTGEVYRSRRALRAEAPVEEAAACASRWPALRGAFELLGRCGPKLSEVLRGEEDPLALLFPGGSTASSESLNRDSALARVYGRLASSAVQSWLGSPSCRGRLRILEIGGGTGGTTSALLEGLQIGRAHV